MFRYFLILLSIMILLTSCIDLEKGNEVKTKSVLMDNRQFKALIPSKPRNLIPHMLKDRISAIFITKIYDNLFNYTDQGGLEGNLVEKWTISDNNKKFNFKLKKGVLFHNLQELTSDDVVFTLKLCFSGKNTMCGKIKHFKEMNKVSKYEFNVIFNRPFIYFLDYLATPSLGIVKNNWGGKNKEIYNKKPIGTGPFVYQKEGVDFVTLARFDKHHNSRFIPKFKTFNFYKFSQDKDPETVLNEFQELNLVMDLFPPSFLKRLTSKGLKKISYPTFETTSILLNQKNKYLKIKKFRKFLFYILKKINIAEVFPGQKYNEATGFIPRGLLGHLREKVVVSKSDAVKAYNNLRLTEKITLNWIISSKIFAVDMALSALNKTLKDFPMISITIQNTNKKDYYSSIFSKAYDLALVTWSGESPNSYFYLGGFQSSSKVNFSSIKDEHLDRFFEKIYEIKKDDISLISSKIDKYLMDEAYTIPLFYPIRDYYYPEYVKGIIPSLQGIFNFKYHKVFYAK